MLNVYKIYSDVVTIVKPVNIFITSLGYRFVFVVLTTFSVPKLIPSAHAPSGKSAIAQSASLSKFLFICFLVFTIVFMIVICSLFRCPPLGQRWMACAFR